LDNWRFRVTEQKCEYTVFAEHVPAGPGLHFSVRIKRNGQVALYMGGA
jgi:hypothetical protein